MFSPVPDYLSGQEFFYILHKLNLVKTHISALMLLFIRTLTLSVLLPYCVIAQQYRPVSGDSRPHSPVAHHLVLQQLVTPETDCSNNIDDDGNGLTDLEDFHCYFSPDNFYGDCKPSKIVWGSSMQYGFFYLNLETGVSKYLPSPVTIGFSDLSWTSDGKLYASGDWGHIYSIDPYTFEATIVGDVEGHYYTNGMTGDNQGNLYVASFVSQYECNILRFNPKTGKSQLIYPLSAHGLISAGDMCFLNGYLYITCLGNKIARLNLSTLELKVIKTINPPLRDDVADVGSYGMVTLGDGYLYITDNRTGIYKVDPNTGQANPFYNYPELDIFTTGLATYPDVCNAPGCRGEVNVQIKSPQPFCSNTGVTVEATGIGINNSPLYTWVRPDQSTVDGQTLKAYAPGEYTVKYHSATDTCSITNSVTLQITAYPSISLGNDTAICKNETYAIQPETNGAVQQYRWQDGSSTSYYRIADTGKYYVTATNVCGSSSDTIQVAFKPTPSVRLRSDTAICQYTYVQLHNLESNNFPVHYQWSTGETNTVIKAYQPGVYWLDVFGVCLQDKVRDSVVVMKKIDDCECFLQIPNAFTPNGDGVNDRFMMNSECVVKGSLQIYNRWGELVFSTTNVLDGWNGMKGSTQQPAGLYVYKVRYEYEGRPGVYTKNGTIHLIH